MRGNSAGDADLSGSRPVVFGRHGAHAQSGADARGGERLSRGGARRCRRPDECALPCARHRQIDRDRPAARHQGCAGRRSQDRQRRGPLRAARLHHRRRGRPDQHRVLRFRGPADRRLRHRGQARPQRRARRAEGDAAQRRYPDRRPRRRRDPDRLGSEPARGAAGGRSGGAAGGRRRQGRQLDHGPRPRPGDAESHRRRGPALDHQADGHRPQRQHDLRHRGREFQQHRRRSPRTTGRSSPATAWRHRSARRRRSPPRCARWKARAWFGHWRNRT